MFLSDIDIKKCVEDGSIIIKPFDEKKLQLASYDVTLGNEFEVTDRYNTTAIDPVNKIFPKTRRIEIADGEEFVLHPGETVLGKQKEFIGVDHKHLMLLSGKSSLARAGLVVHNTAMLFNPGHHFYPTFELLNTNCVPIILRPGMEVAQLLFAQLTSESSKKYLGKDGVGRYDSENSNHFSEAKKK
ncbi:dCTP deaminase [Candidatus Nomurabacteria bacterium]|nr:dCTP deaminase [Candidatus Kaiserbacteria bacterium]MCB9814371.1 dCTP deaminase [Candidatus Nomurabacteria bacterium]